MENPANVYSPSAFIYFFTEKNKYHPIRKLVITCVLYDSLNMDLGQSQLFYFFKHTCLNM